ncbi:MAG: hypothetical protein GXY52_09020 [Chloroflexi bacterium]|nr:hypothetical protein [Chloroflexota bacterium]
MADSLEQTLALWAKNGLVACVEAHSQAQRLGISPEALGQAINAHGGIRVNRCQLGFFGYGEKSLGKHRIVLAAQDILPEIEEALLSNARDGVVSCQHVWAVAKAFEYPYLGIANIAEAMGIKVKPCQLGCF